MIEHDSKFLLLQGILRGDAEIQRAQPLLMGSQLPSLAYCMPLTSRCYNCILRIPRLGNSHAGNRIRDCLPRAKKKPRVSQKGKVDKQTGSRRIHADEEKISSYL
jgi:hypothetical protein